MSTKNLSTENELIMRPRIRLKAEVVERLLVDAEYSHRKIHEQIAYIIDHFYKGDGLGEKEKDHG
jgi:hypothetical protein